MPPAARARAPPRPRRARTRPDRRAPRRSSAATTSVPAAVPRAPRAAISPSAHAACARTSASGSAASVRTSAGTAAGSPRLPSATHTLRRKPSRPARRIGLPANSAGTPASSSSRKRSSVQPSSVARVEPRLARRRREAVPRAHLLADVAAEDPVADSPAAARAGSRRELDREVRDAEPRVDLVGRDDRAGRARVEAARARAAVLALERRVRHRARGRPAPRRAGTTSRALRLSSPACLPIQPSPGALGPAALEDRAGVGVPERVRARLQRAHERLEPAHAVAHHAVVVLAGGVAGDAAEARVARGIGVGRVAQRHHSTERRPCRSLVGSARRSRCFAERGSACRRASRPRATPRSAARGERPEVRDRTASKPSDRASAAIAAVRPADVRAASPALTARRASCPSRRPWASPERRPPRGPARRRAAARRTDAAPARAAAAATAAR